MRIVVINGGAGVGKDSFVAYCNTATLDLVANVSSVDRVKTAATMLGWDGAKDEKGRQFLSDLKDLSTRTYEGPFKYLKQMVTTYGMQGHGYIFLHIREPKEIARFVAEVPGAETLLIRREGVETFDNHADSNVADYPYDHVIDNNGTLRDLETAARRFMERR